MSEYTHQLRVKPIRYKQLRDIFADILSQASSPMTTSELMTQAKNGERKLRGEPTTNAMSNVMKADKRFVNITPCVASSTKGRPMHRQGASLWVLSERASLNSSHPTHSQE